MKKAIKIITVIGMVFFFLLLGCNLFGQTQKEVEAKWVKYGLYQKALSLELPADPLFKIGSYQFTKLKAAGLLGIAVGAIANGAAQGYYYDGGTSFERMFGANPAGFFGSQSWRKRYRDGDPAHGLAHPAYSILPVFDFNHTAQFIANHATYSGGIVLGIGSMKYNRKWWHYALDFSAATATNVLFRAAALNAIRKF